MGELEHPLLEIKKWDEISQIFLFFDYDCQNKAFNGDYSLEENNRRIRNLLDFFNDETTAGKLYINYPMIESIRYTKKLPDIHFYTYTVSISECPDSIFKEKVQKFSSYGSFDFLTLNFLTQFSKTLQLSDKNLKKTKLRSFWRQRKQRKENWKLLIKQTVEKLFFITNSNNTKTAGIFLVDQASLFTYQLEKFILHEEVSVLCAIPLFLYDYMPSNF